MYRVAVLLILSLLVFFNSCKEESTPDPVAMQLTSVKANNQTLDLQQDNPGIPVDCKLRISFSTRLDTASASQHIILLDGQEKLVETAYIFDSDLRVMTLTPGSPLDYVADYIIQIGNQVKGAAGESFTGLDVRFSTGPGMFELESITLNGKDFVSPDLPGNVDYEQLTFVATFTETLDPASYGSHFSLSGNIPLSLTLSQDQKTVTVTNDTELEDYIKYTFSISPNLEAQNGFTFSGFTNDFFTRLDSSYKFPEISDEELLDLLQEKTFRYFFDFGHPASGMARERNTSGDLVTMGGSGFGVMALIVGMERNFITREAGMARLDKMIGFLESCDRFHGAWPHWLNGNTGNAIPFTTEDDGADLVETAFMVQGLLTMRQYLDPGSSVEAALIGRINTLVDEVEWDWFTRGQNVLYWHWSPNYEWQMNMRIQGYNETLITYVLAAASGTHTIEPEVYHQGYARSGSMVNAHCVDNPRDFIGYSEVSWGLTASDNPWGYNAHSPTNDLGVITPTAAVSALPYTPEQSMDAIRHFYYILGDKLWGEYGFYDAFCVTEGWWANSYLAIDQGPIVCMIENHRTGLLWDLFMSAPEVQQGLDKLGFSY
ncbi:MAG: glucoamylase family protein [bacterium]